MSSRSVETSRFIILRGILLVHAFQVLVLHVRVLQVHAFYKSTRFTSPRVLQVHAFYKSTRFTSPRVLQVHAFY